MEWSIHCRALFWCSRLSKAFAQRGYVSIAYDIEFGTGCDLLDTRVLSSILRFMRKHSGIIDLIWLGTPCTSWSRARRWDGGPRPLRDDDIHLMGFQNLLEHDAKKVHEGNQFLSVSCQVLNLATELGIRWALENPLTSRIWLTAKLKRFMTMGAKLFPSGLVRFLNAVA